VSPQVQAAVLQMVENRRSRTDVMMWQVPALAMTAEAFLLSVSLAPDTRGLGRTLAAAAGIVVVSASLQLMLKHRYHEVLFAEWLARAEDALRLPRAHSIDVVEDFAFAACCHPWRRDAAQGRRGVDRLVHDVRRRLVAKLSSVRLWTVSLLLLLALDLMIFITGAATMLGVWDPL